MISYWRVAVEAPLPEALTYQSEVPLERGASVVVPLGKRKARGVVLGPTEALENIDTKSVLEVDGTRPVLPDAFLKWLEWMASYYHYPIGLVLATAFPPLGPTSDKTRKSKKAPVVQETEGQATRPVLTADQKKVLDQTELNKGYQPHLLFGVTGSGKTEVYLQLMEKVLANKKSVLFLVPEISLTPQMINRISSRFPDQVAVLHSQLTDRERTDQWTSLLNKQKRILIGARSALFCPVPDCGLVIVDEEHEPSYKQEEKLRYHARDCAVMRAKMHECPIVLGSATPSLESWTLAQQGKYRLLEMKNRVHQGPLPEIMVVDLKDRDKTKYELPVWMSEQLYQALSGTLEKGYQGALFLNRRGLAPLVLCESCGYIHECPNCDISLTLHQNNHLICHYCDYHENLLDHCPSCKEGEPKPVGLGTEQVENDLKRLFPEKVVRRADRDEIQNRTDMEDLIKSMESGQIDLLVGTQMIAKGLDFPRLQTVGLVLADVGFNLPDFRSPERSFQLMAQMAGRAGRSVDEDLGRGQVLIQTYNPEYPALKFALNHDYVGFAESEVKGRQELGYPPAGRMISLRIQALDLANGMETCRKLLRRSTELMKRPDFSQIEVLGPSESPLAKIRNQYRFQMLLKSNESKMLHRFCSLILGDQKWLPSRTKILVDVDPLHLL